MKHNILNILLVVALFICGAAESVAQERPKLREISDKKLDVAMQGVVPMEKKGECGYADAEGLRHLFLGEMVLAAEVF